MFPFRKTVRKADRVRRYTIQSIDGGWEVITEQDEHSIRRVAYDDWHRVERARRMIALELNTLRAHGWTDVTERTTPQSDSRDPRRSQSGHQPP